MKECNVSIYQDSGDKNGFISVAVKAATGPPTRSSLCFQLLEVLSDNYKGKLTAVAGYGRSSFYGLRDSFNRLSILATVAGVHVL